VKRFGVTHVDCKTSTEAAIHVRGTRYSDFYLWGLVIVRTPTDIFPNIDILVVSIIWNYNGRSLFTALVLEDSGGDPLDRVS